MKIFSQAALLAATVTFIMAATSSAFCQDGSPTADAQPAPMQIMPDSGGGEPAAIAGDCESCSDGCAGQSGCAGPLCGAHHRLRAMAGAVRGCPSCGGRHGPLANGGSAVTSMMHHSGQPLIDHWAQADWIASQRAMTQSWHAGYSHTAWGAPVALVVPPTARMQTRMGWGVSQTTMLPIYHQFERPYPGAMGAEGGAMPGGMPLNPTPRWPSHTDQFGVYYVRGPW